MKSFLTLFVSKIKKRPFAYFVLAPMLVCAIYWIFLASRQYQSTAEFIIKGRPVEASQVVTKISKHGSKVEPSMSYLAQSYIKSRVMMRYVDSVVSLKKHYQSGGIDMISRLSAHSSQAKALKYFRKKVDAEYNPATGKVSISAIAFDPVTAKNTLEAILKKTKRFVSDIDSAAEKGQVAAAQKKIQLARNSLYVAETNLVEAKSKSPKVGNNKFGYDQAMLNIEVAKDEYKLARKAFASTTAQQLSSQESMIMLMPANVPDTYAYPRILYDLLSLFVFLSALYLIGKMIIIIVLEHVD